MRRLSHTQTSVLLAAAVLVGLIGAARAEDTPPLNQKVLDFAKKNKGKKVGNGECWTLADKALESAGAHRPGWGDYGNLVFGKEIKLDKVLPGDVLQFEEVRLEHTDPRGVKSVSELPHHTAIVYSVKGKQITLIHQNVNKVRKVQLNDMNLDDHKAGKIFAYRPQPR
jgi:hypothetical protein